MEKPLTYNCPENGLQCSLKLTAKSEEEVQFRTMLIEKCPACGGQHTLKRGDISVGPRPT